MQTIAEITEQEPNTEDVMAAGIAAQIERAIKEQGQNVYDMIDLVTEAMDGYFPPLAIAILDRMGFLV